MQRPTLSNFRALFPSETIGVCRADPIVSAYCNESQERLMMDPMCPDEGWYGGWVTMNLTGTSSAGTLYVTTPKEIARLIVLGVCNEPIRIRNGFYEYLKFGEGLLPKTCVTAVGSGEFQAFERDSVVTFTDLLSTPQIIRIYPTDVRDTSLKVLLQGKDESDQTILTTDPGTGVSAPGEYVSLALPFVNSTNQFSVITGIQKDQTYGPLQFFQVDPTSGVETELSTMEPNESTAHYRRYFVSGIPATGCCSTSGTVTIRAQGRLDFIPVQNETDYLLIQNVPALIEETMSIHYSRMERGMDRALMHHARALQLLNGQLDAYHGKTNTAVRVSLFGSDRLRAQPI